MEGWGCGERRRGGPGGIRCGSTADRKSAAFGRHGTKGVNAGEYSGEFKPLSSVWLAESESSSSSAMSAQDTLRSGAGEGKRMCAEPRISTCFSLERCRRFRCAGTDTGLQGSGSGAAFVTSSGRIGAGSACKCLQRIKLSFLKKGDAEVQLLSRAIEADARGPGRTATGSFSPDVCECARGGVKSSSALCRRSRQAGHIHGLLKRS